MSPARALRPLLLFLCSSLILTCASDRPLRFDKQEDVGTVHVAIQSVAPFEDYINTLQPQFTLTADQALAAAIQQTQVEDSQLFRALIASLSVATPSVTTSSTKTQTNGVVTADTQTQTKSSGDVSTVPAFPAEATNALGALSLPDTHVSVDLSLKYRAATALMQEVALLNGYVRDAAVQKDSRPYVVRMLVTLTPAARNMPYDAYSTISFFSTVSDDCLERHQVEVIPLLATDTFESSLHQASSQRIRDLASSLKSSLGSTGVEGAIRHRLEDADKSLGQNLNSLFTVARVAPNTVEARLGASFSNGRFSMLARTYDVTVLLLVPTRVMTAPGAQSYVPPPCLGVSYLAQTNMRDAERGTFVPSRNALLLAPELRLIAANLGMTYSASTKESLEQLVSYAERGKFREFERLFKGLNTFADPAIAWNEFVSVAGRMGRSVGQFEIPEPPDSFFFSSARSTLLDDGEHCQLDLAGAARVIPEQVHALLKIVTNDSKEVFLNDTGVSVSQEGRRASIQFPSLKKMLGAAPKCVWATVEYDHGVRNWQTGSSLEDVWYPRRLTDADMNRPNTGEIGERPGELELSYYVIEKPAAKAAAAKFSLTIPSKFIDAKRDGTGELSVELRSAEAGAVQQVHCMVDGAFVAAVNPNVDLQGADLVVPTDKVYLLSLKNLVRGKSVTLHAFRVEGKGKEQKNVDESQVSVEVR